MVNVCTLVKGPLKVKDQQKSHHKTTFHQRRGLSNNNYVDCSFVQANSFLMGYFYMSFRININWLLY